MIIKLWGEGFEKAWHHFAWFILSCLMSIGPNFLILTLFIPGIHLIEKSRDSLRPIGPTARREDVGFDFALKQQRCFFGFLSY